MESDLKPSLLHAEWISFSTCVSLCGLLCLHGQRFAPEALQRVFRYGKTLASERKSQSLVEIPKRWFFHFYVFASLFYSLLLWTSIRVLFYREAIPKSILVLLDAFVGNQRRDNVGGASVAISLVLIQFQVMRRLFECLKLSIYSSEGRMSLIHYFCGFSFYFGVGLSILAEAKGFNKKPSNIKRSDWLTTNHVFGVLLFFIFSFVQFKSHVILAKLRTDAQGRVYTYRHSVPKGFLFELVSCPHYLAEILIYLSINMVFWGQSTTWWMVCSFVTCNQVIVGLFNHSWYKNHFQDYPNKRKAILPFVL